MKKFYFGIALLLIFLIAIKACGGNKTRKLENEIIDLNRQMDELSNYEKEKQKDLEERLEIANNKIIDFEELKDNDSTYLNVKFPSDGNYYKEAYDSVIFYEDPTCTIEIENVRFWSPVIDTAKAKNGLDIYCLRLDSGKICYCTQSPYLITEEKYRERQDN